MTAPRGSTALRLIGELDRLPDHDGTVLFVARLLAPIYGKRLPQTLSRTVLTVRKRRERERKR